MTRRAGFTLMEALVGMLFVLAAGILLPVFAKDLMTGDVLWERRLAIAFVEKKLDEACEAARTASGFDNIIATADSTTDIPTRLTAGRWTQTRDCLNGNDLTSTACGTASLKRLKVWVTWTSRGHSMTTLPDAVDYFISKTGVCGTGV